MRRLIESRRASLGQAGAETALVLPLLLFVVMGIVDFGLMFETRIALANSARQGARYATTHPTAWSNAISAPANTIQGQVQLTGGTASIINDDSHILITYLNPDGSDCGHYSTSGFVGSQSSCVKAGNMIRVEVTYSYLPLTPIISTFIPGGLGITSSATMLEEQ